MKHKYTTNFDAQLPNVQPVILNDMTAYDPKQRPLWQEVLIMSALGLGAAVCFGLSIWFFSWGAR